MAAGGKISRDTAIVSAELSMLWYALLSEMMLHLTGPRLGIEFKIAIQQESGRRYGTPFSHVFELSVDGYKGDEATRLYGSCVKWFEAYCLHAASPLRTEKS